MEKTYKCVCGKTYTKHQNMYSYRKKCETFNKDKDVSETNVGTLKNKILECKQIITDEYRNSDGQLVRSCWVYDENGIITIEQTRMKEWEERIECLVQQIRYWIDNPTEKTIEMVKLFY